MQQTITSAKTSINSKKFPAIYNKLDWLALRQNAKHSNPVVLDIGAGRYIEHIKEFVESKGFTYAPYDPYNLPKSTNVLSLRLEPDVIICSNVLNVIKEDDVIHNLHVMIRIRRCPFFITVYQGNKTSVGASTMNGQSYQRNAPLSSYIFSEQDITYRNVLTSSIYKKYIIK